MCFVRRVHACIPGTHCTGGWAGHSASLDGRKFSPPTGIRSRIEILSVQILVTHLPSFIGSVKTVRYDKIRMYTRNVMEKFPDIIFVDEVCCTVKDVDCNMFAYVLSDKMWHSYIWLKYSFSYRRMKLV